MLATCLSFSKQRAQSYVAGMEATINSYLPLERNSDVSATAGDASPQKKGTGVSEVGWWIKTPAAQSNDMNFIPGTHVVEGDN